MFNRLDGWHSLNFDHFVQLIGLQTGNPAHKPVETEQPRRHHSTQPPFNRTKKTATFRISLFGDAGRVH